MLTTLLMIVTDLKRNVESDSFKLFGLTNWARFVKKVNTGGTILRWKNYAYNSSQTLVWNNSETIKLDTGQQTWDRISMHLFSVEPALLHMSTYSLADLIPTSTQAM